MEKALKEAGWAFVFALIAVLIVASVIALAESFTASEFNQFFLDSWLLIVVSVFSIALVRFLIVILPSQILTVAFLCIAFFFLITSIGSNPTALSIRDFFEDTFHVDLAYLGLAVVTVLLALVFMFPHSDEE